MFRYVFKNSNITIKIYKEQNFTVEERQQIIYEHHNSPVGGTFMRIAYSKTNKT